MPLHRKDFLGITDQYLDTAAYNLDPSFNYYLQDPRELDQRRLRAYKYYMDFYDGKHWDDVIGSVTMSEWNPAYGYYYSWNEDFNRRTWNISRNIVDKLVDWMCQEEWKNKIPPDLEPEADQDSESKDGAQEILDNIWIANERHQWMYDLAYQQCITGDAFVRLSYDSDFYAQDIGEFRLTVLDSRTVTPYWDGQNKRKMVGCRIQYPVREVQEDGSVKQRMYQEVHTASSIVELLDGEISNSYPNPLNEVMIVHFPNEPLPYRKYGRSDLETLLLPNKEFNDRASDISEILAYHAAPITIIKGARVQNLEKGARKIWGGIPKDGDVSNLELESDLAASLNYLEAVKKHLHECGNVPEEALGALQEVSNTSAAALHIQYQPLIERIKKKQISNSRGLRTLNRMLLMLCEMAKIWKPPADLAPSRKYRTEIEWGDALPRDRSLELADIATEVGLGIESKKGALIRLGCENPDQKLEEIGDEQREDAQLQYETAGISGQLDTDNTTGSSNGTSPGAEDGPQNDVSGAVNASKTNSANHGSAVAQQAVKKAAQAGPAYKQ